MARDSMVVAVAVVVTTIGCGRLGYGLLGSGDGGAAPDAGAVPDGAAIDAPRVDGAPPDAAAATVEPFAQVWPVLPQLWDVAVDSGGNVYVAASITGPTDLGDGMRSAAGMSDAVVISHGPTGAFRWVWAGGASARGSARSVAARTGGGVWMHGMLDGNATIAGTPLDSGAGQDSLIVELTADATELSARAFGAGRNVQGWDVVELGSAALALVGPYGAPFDPGLGLLPAVDGADHSFAFVIGGDLGAVRWQRGLVNVGNVYVRAADADSAENVCLAGSFDQPTDFGAGAVPTVGSGDGFVTSYDSTGNYRWAQVLGSVGEEHAWGVAATEGGGCIVVGSVSGPADFGGRMLVPNGQDGYVARYDGMGAFMWIATLSGPDAQTMTEVEIAGGRVFVAGRFAGGTTFLPFAMISSGGDDGLVGEVAFGSGTPLWTTVHGAAGDEMPRGLAVDPGLDSTVVAGVFLGSTSIGGSTAMGDGGYVLRERIPSM